MLWGGGAKGLLESATEAQPLPRPPALSQYLPPLPPSPFTSSALASRPPSAPCGSETLGLAGKCCGEPLTLTTPQAAQSGAWNSTPMSLTASGPLGHPGPSCPLCPLHSPRTEAYGTGSVWQGPPSVRFLPVHLLTAGVSGPGASRALLGLNWKLLLTSPQLVQPVALLLKLLGGKPEEPVSEG